MKAIIEYSEVVAEVIRAQLSCKGHKLNEDKTEVKAQRQSACWVSLPTAI